MISVLVARALNYQGSKHITVAALIEFIHTATLLHDDVVDESDMRRGKATANAAFGNAASVLVGDYIYTRSFQMMTGLQSMRVLTLMSEATNVIAEGEVLQLMNCNNPDITEESYMQVIYSKTARLFEAAAQSAAILSDASEEQELALQNYGRYLGTAFQLIDDLLDYSAEGSTLGKNTGDDLNEGKPTLPLLHAMHNGTPEQAAMIRQAIEQGMAVIYSNQCWLPWSIVALWSIPVSVLKKKQIKRLPHCTRYLKVIIVWPLKAWHISQCTAVFDYSLWKLFRNPDSPSGFIPLMSKRGHILSLPTG